MIQLFDILFILEKEFAPYLQECGIIQPVWDPCTQAVWQHWYWYDLPLKLEGNGIYIEGIDSNPEGDDPEGDSPDPSGSGPNPGQDGNEGDPSDPDKDGNNTNPKNGDSDSNNKSDFNKDSDSNNQSGGDNYNKDQKVDKGKGRAVTPESVPEQPLNPEHQERLYPEPTTRQPDSDDDAYYESQLSEVKRLTDQYQHPSGQSSAQGAVGAEIEAALKEEVKDLYKKAVTEFNNNQIQIVDNPYLDPATREHLIQRSEKLREAVDFYRILKDDLDIESSDGYSSEGVNEGDDEGDDSDNPDSGSGSDKPRPAKRPRND